jgi:hypothetical protein
MQHEIRITYRHCRLFIHQVKSGFRINAQSNDEDFWSNTYPTLNQAFDAIKAEIDQEYE